MPQQFTPQSTGSTLSAAPLSEARVLDADGNPASLAAGDGEHAFVRLADGSELVVPLTLLDLQEDGSYRLPFSLRAAGDDSGGGVTLRLPLHEERVHVTKRRIDTGRGVRVHKTVHAREQVLDVPLAHDELQVERVAIGEVVVGEQLPQSRQEGDTLIIPVLEEQLVVHKQIVLKEEVRITRCKVSTTQQQTVTLRSEAASLERFADGPARPVSD